MFRTCSLGGGGACMSESCSFDGCWTRSAFGNDSITGVSSSSGKLTGGVPS
jgi:hypothetical protein